MYVFKSAQWLQLVTSWSLVFVRFTFTLHNTTRRLILWLQFLAFFKQTWSRSSAWSSFRSRSWSFRWARCCTRTWSLSRTWKGWRAAWRPERKCAGRRIISSALAYLICLGWIVSASADRGFLLQGRFPAKDVDQDVQGAVHASAFVSLVSWKEHLRSNSEQQNFVENPSKLADKTEMESKRFK